MRPDAPRPEAARGAGRTTGRHSSHPDRDRRTCTGRAARRTCQFKDAVFGAQEKTYDIARMASLDRQLVEREAVEQLERLFREPRGAGRGAARGSRVHDTATA